MRVGFEDRDPVPFHGEVESGGQTREPGADDRQCAWACGSICALRRSVA